MLKSFETLDEAKKKRIMDAAIHEFAERPYEQASTNRIVKEARIGKGMLFHYFETKQALYEYLVERALSVMEELSKQYLDVSEPDFIERMKGSAKLKMKVYQLHPDLFHFIGQVMLENESKIPRSLTGRLEKMQQDGMRSLFSGVDTSKFRKDVPAEEVMKLIGWSIEGYGKELLAKLDGQTFVDLEMESYWDEFHAFLGVLKLIYYK
ncbi:TetR/AcrR family transcriptional regulator [Sporosarcina gallistercoris]|uniref:TetR/AcrR family transcriptional regulator n=1 Tax=Sporosarcina gallistercoris TaxID=2762245 RepID=A0ABR8PM78_9BACL|nr:TetR/AcrR family transcriptional regulator [Sporosarcina gallistercoris]MBD7909288.1 TetR/AcrR family transcriptional regulator [Sporosarcina gallistercoris]